MSERTWRADNLRWLRLRLEKLRLQMQAYADSTRGADGRDPGSWWSVADTAAADNVVVQPHIKAVDVELDRLAGSMKRPPALATVTDLAGLDRFEADLLLLAASTGFDAGFPIACAELQGDARRDHPTPALALHLFVEPARRLGAMDALLPEGPLRRLRLVEVAGFDEPMLHRRLDVDQRMGDYLRGVNRVDARLSYVLDDCRPDGDTAYVDRRAREIVRTIEASSGRWTTINLTGPPECGARDTIARAASMVGMRPMSLDLARLARLDRQTSDDLLSLMAREAVLGGLAYVVQCPEPATETARLVDELIRDLGGPLFLVSRHPWRTRHDVTVLSLEAVTRSDQVELWRAGLVGVPNSVNGEIDAIVHHFDLGPAAIGDTIHQLRAARGDEPVDGSSLWRAVRERATADIDLLADKIEPAYSWSDIVLDDRATTQLHQLADQVRQRTQVFDNWGFAPHASQGRGITAMFAGPSGTGKTMAAEIIAGELELGLLRINLSGIVSKYVGETSKNLQRIFDAAQRSGAILLFDEADAVFGTRTAEVRDSHDRYSVLEISHLLQLMQDYRGLAILATNRRAAVDGAFLRRLRFVIEFGFPGAAERSVIWQRSFPAAASCEPLDFGQLAQLELPGGNIRSIAVNAAFLAAAAGHPIRMADVMAAARHEYAKIARPVDADEFGPWAGVTA